MAKKKIKPEHNDEVKMIKPKLTEDDLIDMSEDEAFERAYYQDSIIVKINPNDKLIDDIATCFNIEDTMDYLMLAPLEFISRTDGIENEKEYKERLWRQVRIFYKSAQEMLNKRYRL